MGKEGQGGGHSLTISVSSHNSLNIERRIERERTRDKTKRGSFWYLGPRCLTHSLYRTGLASSRRRLRCRYEASKATVPFSITSQNLGCEFLPYNSVRKRHLITRPQTTHFIKGSSARATY